MRSHSQDVALVELLTDATDEDGTMTLTHAHYMRMGPDAELRTQTGWPSMENVVAQVWSNGEVCAAAYLADGEWHPDMSIDDEVQALTAEADYLELTAKAKREQAERLRSHAAEIASR